MLRVGRSWARSPSVRIEVDARIATHWPALSHSKKIPPAEMRDKTVAVEVGSVQIGAGAPIAERSMSTTDTADINSTTLCAESWQKCSER